MNLRTLVIGGISALLGIFLAIAFIHAAPERAAADPVVIQRVGPVVDTAQEQGQNGKANGTDTSTAAFERQLAAARKSRIESAQKALEAAQAAFQAETITVNGLVDATRNLVEAEVDGAVRPQDEIAAWTRYVKVAKQVEDGAKQLYNLGVKGGEAVTYYTAKQERERAEIALLKAQIKAGK